MFSDFFKSKNRLIIELDDRYFDKKSLMNAIVQHLTNEGKKCEVIDVDFLLVDGKKYSLSQKNVVAKYCPPVQQAVLTEID